MFLFCHVLDESAAINDLLVGMPGVTKNGMYGLLSPPSPPEERGRRQAISAVGRALLMPGFNICNFPISTFASSSLAMAHETITDVLAKPDVALEMTLRPSLFSEFTGQAKVKERLEITVAAARQRGEPIDHLLLSGPPGLGKTTLAHILAKAMGANLKSTSGPTIEKAGDLA